MKLILASKSPRRKRILEKMGFKFEIEPSHADESQIKEKDPIKLVIALAELKAEVVAKNHNDAIVLGADTMVYHNGESIGKARSEEEAFALLRKLMGKEHMVYSGLCAINTKTGEKKIEHSESKVKLRTISEKELNEYVKGGYYKGKAGAYNIDDPEFQPFVEKVDGDKFNIMGMSFAKGMKILVESGITPENRL